MDKYINLDDSVKLKKIIELKKEINKLKKYKNFVEKSKDTKQILDDIIFLQKEQEKYKELQKRYNDLLKENKLLSNNLDKLKQSELSFVNKNTFYHQEMTINSLKQKIQEMEREKEEIKENNKEILIKNEKLERVVDKIMEITKILNDE